MVTGKLIAAARPKGRVKAESSEPIKEAIIRKEDERFFVSVPLIF